MVCRIAVPAEGQSHASQHVMVCVNAVPAGGQSHV